MLHLQNTLEAQASAPSLSTIDTVKHQLEAKIQELGGLVAELGQMNRKGGDTAPCTGKTATKKTPDERQWRSALGLQEVENAMLPTITESKAYPRMTLKYALVLIIPLLVYSRASYVASMKQANGK